MPSLRRFAGISLVADRFARCYRAMRPHKDLILITVAAFAVAIILSLGAHQIQPDERVVAGNTGGSLTVLLELDQSRVLVGAGPSRSHAADLLGRTTRPWDRSVELLILPGWDDHHVSGALGLIERQSVEGIAVIGIPGEEPIWTLLERETEQQGIDLVYVDRAAKLQLSSDSAVYLSPLDGPDDGTWVRLDHQNKRIDLVDAARSEFARPDRSVMQSGGEHVFVNLRGYSAPSGIEPELLVTPKPFWQSDFAEVSASHWVSLERNDHVPLTLNNGEIRIPLETVDRGTD